jgi:phage terminase large subunit
MDAVMLEDRPAQATLLRSGDDQDQQPKERGADRRVAELPSSRAWPPDYVKTYAWRQRKILDFRKDPLLLFGAKEFYKAHPAKFIGHWCDTYDPRNAGSGVPARMPFILFQRQIELVDYLHDVLKAEESGLVEKCRDMGATWVCCAFSVWLWKFWEGASVGWGSRKEQLVDRIGDADSIFEKMRMIIAGLPSEFKPAGFNSKDHATYMRIINPENGATITGESGDNIGRGGRKLIYFKDESAHYEHAEKIEAALTDNTRCQIDISSVNGLGNVFHRRREAGVDWAPGEPILKGRTSVFVMDWRDHPAKTQEWYDARRKKATDDGLLHLFAQEVDRNYSASVEGIIIPAEWVAAAIDAHIKLKFDDSGMWCAALDVADEGGDTNALALRKGVILKSVEEWGERDTGNTARRAVSTCRGLGSLDLQYDSVGVGAGIKAETNRLNDEQLLPKGLQLVPWNGGAAVQDPKFHVIPDDAESPLNEDFYTNLKAQAWWNLRRRFELTWRALNELGFHGWRADDLISLPSTLTLLRKLQKELSQPTASQGARLKLLVDKKPEGTRSPNLADSVVMVFWPIKPIPTAQFGVYGRSYGRS